MSTILDITDKQADALALTMAEAILRENHGFAGDSESHLVVVDFDEMRSTIFYFIQHLRGEIQ